LFQKSQIFDTKKFLTKFFALKYILKVNSNESINKVAMGPEHKKQQKHPKSLTVKIESVLVV